MNARKPARVKLPAPKTIKLDAAIALMRDGCLLVLMTLPASEGGHAYYVTGGRGGGRVSDETAEALLERNDVQPGGDNFSWGRSQTYRMKTARRAKR
jgi:hypothetical protein